MFLPVYIYFELLSLLFAIWFYRGLRKFKLVSFVWILLASCAADISGAILSELKISNYYIYNSYLAVSTPLYFYAFYKMLAYRRLAKLFYLVISLAIVFFIWLNICSLQGFSNFNTYSLIVSEFALGFLSLLTLLKLFNDNDFQIKLQRHPYFWLSGSTLIFSVSTLVLLGLLNFIRSHHIEIDGQNIYRVLIPGINIILYGSCCYAFYLCNKITPRYLQQ